MGIRDFHDKEIGWVKLTKDGTFSSGLSGTVVTPQVQKSDYCEPQFCMPSIPRAPTVCLF